MSLDALLAEVDPRWHRAGDEEFDAGLLSRARASRLGRRLLVGALAEGPAAHLLAPAPDGFAGLIERWSRARLDALHRDLGILAYAPVIRAEVRREAVKQLKAALGNGYLLALDRSIWDAKVGTDVQARLASSLGEVLGAGEGVDVDARLAERFERQGRAELQAWATQREPTLADWARLLHAPEALPPAHLPEKPLLVVHTHHQNRAVAA